MSLSIAHEKRRNEWQNRVVDFRVSGQTQTAWCALHGTSTHQLRVWLSRFPDADKGSMEGTSPRQPERSERQPSDWVSLSVDGGAAATSGSEHLVIRVGRAEVEVREGFDAGLLAAVMKVLSTAC